MEKIFKKLQMLFEKEIISLVHNSDNERLLIVAGGITPLCQSYSVLRKVFFERFKIFLNTAQLQTLIEFLEIHPLTDDTVYESACRIYNGKDCLAYELNKDTEECIVITPEEINISNVPNVYFKHAADFENQVEPSWDVEPKDIFSYIHHHFNLKNEKQEKLLVLYLVTAFFGLQISHSLLILTGEKGSSKSNRISAKKIKSEQELWEEFEQDRPKILGCIFLILSEALYDDKPITVKEKIRLADFHIACRCF